MAPVRGSVAKKLVKAYNKAYIAHTIKVGIIVVRGKEGIMASKNSSINNTSIDLELEAIRRFRCLVPFLDPECQVFRELNGSSTVLCLDFTACPQDLKMNQKEWQEVAQLLLYASHYLGLANTLVFKTGDRVLGWMSLKQKKYFGEFFAGS